MDEKQLSDPVNNVSLIKDELHRSNTGSSGDSEKVIQRLNDELREALELVSSEKLKCTELHGLLEDERRENKHQTDESVKQIKLLQGQLRQLQDEVGVAREQRDHASSSAREEVKSLQRALQAATSEREREVTAIHTNLATVTKDLEKWRQAANKYEHEIENLQSDLQQQGRQWQKTAEIQAGELQSMQKECNGLQKECSALRAEKHDIANKHEMEKSSVQSECAGLRLEKEELLKTHQKEKEAMLKKQQQLEDDFASSRAQNDELNRSINALERSQEELEKRVTALKLQHQQDSTKLQTQLDEADSRTQDLQRENDELNRSNNALERSQEELEKRVTALKLQHQQDSTKLQTQLDEADSRTQDLQREYEEAVTELSDLKEKYEKTEQEKQAMADELQECQASMTILQEKGTKTSLLLPVQAIVIGLILALLFWCFGALW